MRIDFKTEAERLFEFVADTDRSPEICKGEIAEVLQRTYGSGFVEARERSMDEAFSSTDPTKGEWIDSPKAVAAAIRKLEPK